MKKLLSLLALVVVLYGCASKPEMKAYYLVLLNKGPNRSQDSSTAANIQAGHMANLNRLADLKKIVMAGPIGMDTTLRGIFVFDAESKEEVDSLVQTDPAVQSGRLKPEVYPWWSQRGVRLP
jgi:uncharacterized protein YciI